MSNSKKHDLPAMPFYVGDWLKCPEVRALTPEARGLWIDMLCYMWESKDRGYLMLNGKAITTKQLSRMVGIAEDLLGVLLQQLQDFAVFSVTPENVIFCRRMVKDEKIRRIRSEVGQKGGFATAKRLAKSQQMYEDENENEIEEEDIKKKEGIVKGREQIPPLLKDVMDYCKERNRGVDPNKWYDFYQAKGWLIGKNKMKDWKAAVRTWEQKELNKGTKWNKL